MTPEELANARGIAKRIPEVSTEWIDRSNSILVVAANFLPKAVAHIDAQAAQIEALKDALVEAAARQAAGVTFGDDS